MLCNKGHNSQNQITTKSERVAHLWNCWKVHPVGVTVPFLPLHCCLPSSTSSLWGWRRWCVPLSSPPAAPGGTPTPHNRACSFCSDLENTQTHMYARTVCIQYSQGLTHTHTHSTVAVSTQTRVSGTEVATGKENRSEMGLHAWAVCEGGRGQSEIRLKGKDTSGVMLLCKKEAERKDKGWNSQSFVQAGSMREWTSQQQDLSVQRGSGDWKGRSLAEESWGK